MEPTPGEYPSKMRVALVRRNPADGAAPLGLKKSRTSKSLQPYPFTPLSLTLQSLPPVAASTRRPVRGPHAAGHERGPRPRPHSQERTPGARAGRGAAPWPRPHARSARRRVKRAGDRPRPHARTASRRPRPQARSPAAAHARQLRLGAGLVSASRPCSSVPIPPPVPPLFKVNPVLFPVDPCWIVHPCSCVKDV